MCKQIIGDNEICRLIAGNFDHHADVAVQCGAHCPMEHIQGFTRNHWMLPSGKCLRRIAPAAVIVDELVENTQKTNKKLFSASNLRYNQPLVACENLIPKMDPLLMSLARLPLTLTQMPLFKLKSSATFWAIKHCQWTKIWKVIKRPQSLLKLMVHMCAISG
jgi:hypothetical protein